MAEQFFTAETTAVLAEILEPQYNSSVGRAAAWADAYAHTTEGRFSYQWHWIDTHDKAPEYCNLDYEKDCAKGGCVVSAIANQTGILRECINDSKSGVLSGGTNLTCSYALKWVAHFFGDIHQPLHANARAIGGNTYKVIFANVTTQLHAVRNNMVSSDELGLTVARSGTITFLISQQTSVNRSRTNPSTLSSPALYRASVRMSFTRHHTRG